MPRGGILPGATIVSMDMDTGMGYTLLTNAAGAYVFPSLPPGPYKVTVSMSGFETYVRDGLILKTGLTLSVDANLPLAGIQETLTVTGDTPLIQTRESKVGGVVDDNQIENIPINTRDVQQCGRNIHHMHQPVVDAARWSPNARAADDQGRPDAALSQPALVEAKRRPLNLSPWCTATHV